MRPLPRLNPRPALGLSLCGHAAALAVLLFLRFGDEPAAPSASIIQAELIARTPAPRTASIYRPRELPPPAATDVPDATERLAPPALEAVPPEAESATQAPTPAVAPESAPEPAPPSDTGPPAATEPIAPAASRAAAPAPEDEGRAPPSVAPEPEVAERVRRELASWTGRLTPDDPTQTLEWRDRGERYTAVLTKLPAADPMGMEQLRVELTTERDGTRLGTELRMTRVAFSNFAQFVDRWDPNVLIHDDVIDGRFHSNTKIGVSRGGRVQPLFHGKVTLAARDVGSDGIGFLNRRTMFPAGLETSVRRIVLPARTNAFDAAAVPTARIHRIARDAALTFRADGSYEWRHLDGSDGGRRSLDDEPYYVVAADDASLAVNGTVNGKVLVYSPQRIVVTSSVRYASDPRAAGADDYLGLVAERTVEIDGPEVTGPGDLEIQASIYARQRFVVRRYRSRPSGTLAVYGSVTAGSLGATEPRFATKIEFDERLTTMRAPGFPLSDRYELDSWDGEWRVVRDE